MSSTMQAIGQSSALASEEHVGDNFLCLDDALAPDAFLNRGAQGEHAKDRVELSTSTVDTAALWRGDRSVELGAGFTADGKDFGLQVGQVDAPHPKAEAGAPSGPDSQSLADASNEPDEEEKWAQWTQRREERRARVAGRRAERTRKFDSQLGNVCSGKFCSSDCRSCK